MHLSVTQYTLWLTNPHRKGEVVKITVLDEQGVPFNDIKVGDWFTVPSFPGTVYTLTKGFWDMSYGVAISLSGDVKIFEHVEFKEDMQDETCVRVGKLQELIFKKG